MSVFTHLEHHQLEAFVAAYPLGRLLGFSGISAGSENSNYFVSLESGEYVLTLVERGPVHDLPFFVALLERLHQAGLAVPYAIPGSDGQALRQLQQRPALLQPRLAGKHVQQPNASHCAAIGQWLGQMHRITLDQPLERPSDRGLDWMMTQGQALLASLPATQQPLLADVLDQIGTARSAILALPRANLHADLFRDNALFEGTHLSGVIDFYNACCGPMLYDLAIALNDWCSEAEGALDAARSQALLAAYAAERPLLPQEQALWPVLLRIACVRFWLSRLIASQEFAGQDVLIHDPDEFRKRLEHRQSTELPNLPMAL